MNPSVEVRQKCAPSARARQTTSCASRKRSRENPLVDLFEIGQQIGVRQHGALGNAGGAAGILEERNVILGQLDRRKRRVAAFARAPCAAGQPP